MVQMWHFDFRTLPAKVNRCLGRRSTLLRVQELVRTQVVVVDHFGDVKSILGVSVLFARLLCR